MKLIYDAAFAVNNGSKPEHLGEFWWKESDGTLGKWNNRETAHDYVAANPGTVEAMGKNGSTAIVLAYHRVSDPSIRWIQTEADSTTKDNLITLAQQH